MHKCLLENESVEIKSVNLPSHVVNKDNWHVAVEAFRKKMDKPDWPAIKVFESYNLCPLPLISELSVETWKLYNMIGGLGKVSSPQDYYSIQALYFDGVQIIEKALVDIQPYIKAAS